MKKSVTMAGVPVRTRTGHLEHKSLEQPLVQLHFQHFPSARSPTESMTSLGDGTPCSLVEVK
jgi:hypothetical protein